jgi:predicted AlkP superfamily pyrophosphatase or phosphodiesterase
MVMRNFVLGVAALFSATAAQASPVLLISLDGLRPADIVHAEERGLKVPHLRALMKEGAYAEGVTGVLPTLTYPSHTTLITGKSPAQHGIGNNLSFDPLQINQQGWDWYAADIKVPTLWDAAHAKGLKTANVHWPVSVGAASIDENLPQIWRTGHADDRKLLAALATPGLLLPLEKMLGPYPQGIDEAVEGDAIRARFAAAIITRDKPDFTTVYLAGIDHEQHHSGPGSDASKTAIEATDAIVGDLVAAAQRAMPDVTVAVVSDHGFAPITTDINIIKAFIDEKLITLGKDGKIASWEAEPWLAGGTAAVVLARPDDAGLVARVAALLDRMKADLDYHVMTILDATRIAAAGGPAPASFLIALQPGYETGRDPAAPKLSPSVYKGMHGYLPELPEMQSTLIVAGPHLARRGNLGVVDMRAIAPSLANILGVSLNGEVPTAF